MKPEKKVKTMEQTKRINLSFDLRDKEARKVYKILICKRSTKTAFVIKAVLEYEENNIPITKQIIKDAVKEAVEEVGTTPVPLDMLWIMIKKLMMCSILSLIYNIKE